MTGCAVKSCGQTVQPGSGISVCLFHEREWSRGDWDPGIGRASAAERQRAWAHFIAEAPVLHWLGPLLNEGETK